MTMNIKLRSIKRLHPLPVVTVGFAGAGVVVFKQLGSEYPSSQRHVPFCVHLPCPLQLSGQAGPVISATETHFAFLQANPLPHLTPSKATTKRK